MKKLTYTIDASGQALGRVASKAATLLRGKGEAVFARHTPPDIGVIITNIGRAKISLKKLQTEKYTWYTGYPGGQRQETRGEMVVRKGVGELFKRAVRGMIPNNKLRPAIMKNLTVKE